MKGGECNMKNIFVHKPDFFFWKCPMYKKSKKLFLLI